MQLAVGLKLMSRVHWVWPCARSVRQWLTYTIIHWNYNIMIVGQFQSPGWLYHLKPTVAIWVQL